MCRSPNEPEPVFLEQLVHLCFSITPSCNLPESANPRITGCTVSPLTDSVGRKYLKIMFQVKYEGRRTL